MYHHNTIRPCTFQDPQNQPRVRSPKLSISPGGVKFCLKITKSAQNTVWRRVVLKPLPDMPSPHLFIPYNCIYAQPSSNTNTHSLCVEVKTNFILAELLASPSTGKAKSGQVVGKRGEIIQILCCHNIIQNLPTEWWLRGRKRSKLSGTELLHAIPEKCAWCGNVEPP